jgi:hypothetical protein
MNRNVRRPLASWRAPDRCTLRPELWVVALVALGMLLVEVWQSSRMAELCLALDHNRVAVQKAQARLEYCHAQLDRRTTRAELAPQANLLGLVPVDVSQMVQLPPEYLAAADGEPGQDSRPVLAWVEGVSHALVPEARARDRNHANGRTDEP